MVRYFWISKRRLRNKLQHVGQSTSTSLFQFSSNFLIYTKHFPVTLGNILNHSSPELTVATLSPWVRQRYFLSTMFYQTHYTYKVKVLYLLCTVLIHKVWCLVLGPRDGLNHIKVIKFAIYYYKKALDRNRFAPFCFTPNNFVFSRMFVRGVLKPTHCIPSKHTQIANKAPQHWHVA